MGGVNYCILTFIRSLTISSVDVFVLITGYFLCTSYKRTIRKPLDLLIQVSLFSVTIYLSLILLGAESFSIKGLLGNIVPDDWFISLYVVLYLISPYINAGFCTMTKKDWKVFLIIIVSLFSISPTLLGITESFGVRLTALSTIGIGGNAAGYTLINFITLYCIGAYIRLFNISDRVSFKKTSIAITICVILLWLIRFIPINSTPWHIAGWYDNILVIILASSLFITFKKLKFRSKMINALALASLTVYIIHYPLFKLVNPVQTLHMPIAFALLHIALFVISLLAIAFIMNFIYSRCSAKYMGFFDKYRVPYFENNKDYK